MTPPLRFYLLSEFRFFSGDTLLGSFNTPRLQSLLAYLVHHHDPPQPRRQIAFSLWPDRSEARARANLRKLLDQLQPALLEAAREPQQIDLGAHERLTMNAI